MNTISFRLKSELKFQTVDISSTFILAGELRQLICDKLRLDQSKETVQLWDVNDSSGSVEYTDEKQIPRGSKIRVARTPINHRSNVESAPDLASEPPAEASAPEPTTNEQEPEEEDEFGGNLFDEEQQIRQHNQEAAKRWQAELSAGQRQARFRAAAFQSKSGGQPPVTGPCPICGLKGQRHKLDCPHFKESDRKRGPSQPKGIPTSFMTIEPPAPDADVQTGKIKFKEGELQREQQKDEDEKAEAERIANALPTLAPLPAMRLEMDDADQLAIIQAQLAASSDTRPQNTLTPPTTTSSEPAALPAVMVNPSAPDPSTSQAIVVHNELPQPVESALKTDASLYRACRSFLPKATAEQLFAVFALPAPLSRAEWESFVRREHAALADRSLSPPHRSSSRLRGSDDRDRRRRAPVAVTSHDGHRPAHREHSARHDSGARYRERSLDRSADSPPPARRRDLRSQLPRRRRSISPALRSNRSGRRTRDASPASSAGPGDSYDSGRSRSVLYVRADRARTRSVDPYDSDTRPRRNSSRREQYSDRLEDRDLNGKSGRRAASRDESPDRYEPTNSSPREYERARVREPSAGASYERGSGDAGAEDESHRRRKKSKRDKKDRKDKRHKHERRDRKRSVSVDDKRKRRRVEHDEDDPDKSGSDTRKPGGNLVKQAFSAIGVR